MSDSTNNTKPRKEEKAHKENRRDVRLDLLRAIAIIECIVAHALLADHTDENEYLFRMVFMPDTAGVFFMASGAIILNRHIKPGWKYIWHRISTFLPEFVIFSILYVFLNHAYGFVPDDKSVTATMQICYLWATPTWGPGWFVLTLIGLYIVVPMMWSWVTNASRRDVEIAIALWLLATIVPVITPHTPVNVPETAFGTLFNYAGYMLLGYYLVHWPLIKRSANFKILFFGATIVIGIILGYFLARSGVKWGYIRNVTTGLSLNIVMLSLLQFGIVMIMPERWFNGIVGRCATHISILSLGIYCCHWLVIRYWAIPDGVSWYIGTAAALAVSIPVAWIMRRLRLIAGFKKIHTPPHNS